jgi:hypothetical protein
MTTLTETGHAGGFLLSEANGSRSRDVVTIVSGQNLKAGAVLGKISASGKYKAYDNGAGDGSQAAAAILFDDVDASGGDKTATAIVRDAEVNKNELVYAVGQDQTSKDASVVDFAALGILVR